MRQRRPVRRRRTLGPVWVDSEEGGSKGGRGEGVGVGGTGDVGEGREGGRRGVSEGGGRKEGREEGGE